MVMNALEERSAVIAHGGCVDGAAARDSAEQTGAASFWQGSCSLAGGIEGHELALTFEQEFNVRSGVERGHVPVRTNFLPGVGRRWGGASQEVGRARLGPDWTRRGVKDCFGGWMRRFFLAATRVDRRPVARAAGDAA